MTSYNLLRRSQELDEESIRKAISGNICRCTGYSRIVDAILLASGADKEGEVAPSRDGSASASP
jgi:carbon-monoxide dehydrogenase small subunit